MKQLTEDYCSFEVAKLLKEKGFRAVTNRYYNAQYDQIRTVSDTFIMDWNDEEYMKSITMPGAIAIPTHQMALKWLREVHNIHITILQIESTTITMEQKYFFYRIQKNRRTVGIFEDTFLKYEQAVEAALKYTLENLI